MSKRRLKFSKTGMGKYISHLDLLRAFTRAITRAELPVRYTQGFNPHQIITFALPLPIGVTGETEFVDVDFEETASNDEIMEKLNRSLPPDIRILKVGELNCNAADIVSAEYKIRIIAPCAFERDKVEEFYAQKEIPVIKKTKKGEKEVNLAEYIKSARIDEISGNEINMRVILAAGGVMNIKPEIMINKLEEALGMGEFDEVYIHRTKIFCDENGVLKEMY